MGRRHRYPDKTSALSTLRFVFVISLSIAIYGPVHAIEKVQYSTGCDKALHIFWKGKLAGNREASLAFYRHAIELCPGFIRPYELAGNIYRKQGQIEQAVVHFKKAVKLGSANHKLYYLLATLMLEAGDADDAHRHIRQALEIRPDDPMAIELKRKIEKSIDQEGPDLLLYEPVKHRGVKFVYTHGNVTVRGIATDKSGVAWVKINEYKVVLDKQGNFFWDVPIQTGKNTITVAAEDRRGNLSQLSVSVMGKVSKRQPFSRIERPAQAGNIYGKSHAVVIGIDQYAHWPPLEFAAADALSVKEAIENTGFNEITLLLNKEATQRRILTELFESLPQKVGRNDRVFFYFAGHGQTEALGSGGHRGYIIPVDAGYNDYSATAVSMDQIRSLSRNIPAKHILYVMDSCYSGLGFNRSAGVSPRISDYLLKISGMRAVQIITAGGKDEQVQEKAGHGLFTNYFLQALIGDADSNKDNVVTGTELGTYLRPRVSNASNHGQTPLFGRLEGGGEFMFFVGQ
jgi:Caspase domain/Tetratricopeptide repeat/Glucodextranase, domain B